jgi:hypothetical protein
MTGKSAGCAPSLSLHPGIPLTIEEKRKRKYSVRLFEKWQLDTILYVDMATFRHVVLTSLPIPVSLGLFGRPASTLCQHMYLPTCRIKVFPISRDFEWSLV